MKTIKTIAAGACKTSAIAVFAAAFLAGCSALPSPPSRPVHYDFGPGAMASGPADRRAPLPPLALADLEAPGLVEGSTAVVYRLAYADARQLRPYSQARWSQPPAQLLQQRLREQLGLRRAVLKADDGAVQAREPARGNKLPLVLRTELEEFSHLFTSPSDSAGVVRLRATVVELTPAGESLRGQRVFIVQQPAKSADAAGGVAALAAASGQLASELAAWVEQVGQ
ncbi:ABC-type transport auxiliary lipoprotein family protein [Acidovorax soli]|uniref:ABC-type transport auxiliary lipoprotein family protein n=1 Tax=Acidovorax soli TaxID=592050 RepID=UPI0032B155E6